MAAGSSEGGLTPLPALSQLGGDLLATSPAQRWTTLLRPFLCVAVYALAGWAGWWWLLPLLVFLTFVAVVTATHDVVHDTLGLSRRAGDLWLGLLGAVLFESGHAYRLTHLNHHARFPADDDPEGDPARLSFAASLLHGPVFLYRLWAWAWRRAGRSDRAWLLAEALWFLGGVAAALLAIETAPAFSAYVLMAIVGSWVYPLLTVHLPHHDYGDHPLTQTRTLRGRLIPALFLELTYHLEHHLYPAVPSHHLPRLAERLEPVLREHGVEPVRVP